MPCIPSSFPLFILNAVFHSCKTKGLLALFTHYPCIRFFCFSCSTQFPVNVLKLWSAPLLYSAHIFSSTLLFQGAEGASPYFFFFASFSVTHHSFSVHEGVHDNIINTQHSGRIKCNDPQVLTTCLIVILTLMFSCVMKQNCTPQRILSINADIPTVAEILLKIIPTLEEVRLPFLDAYLDECHLNVELTTFFWCSISIIKGWTLIASCGCWSIRV